MTMRQFSAEWPTQPGPEGSAYFVTADSIAPGPRDKGLGASALARDIRSLDLGEFLLLDTPYATIALDEETKAHFNEIPELGLSRQRSAQEVAFGQLIVSSEAEREAADLVAIKPYNLVKGAVQEAGALHVVNNIPINRTGPLSFEPLGFYRYHDGTTGLITRYDAAVKTQDNIFWDPNYEPSEPEVERAFQHAAVALGVLHEQALAHKDAQVKNMARDNRGVRIVDLTDMRRMTDEGARDDVIRDISEYVSSLTHVDKADGGHVFDRDYTQAFINTFPLHYTLSVNTPESRLPAAARMTSDDIAAIAQSPIAPPASS